MKLANTFTDLASAAGVGAIAGLAGTAAMTASSTIESRLRHREPSQTPAAAAGSVLGVVPKDDRARTRFNNFAHWAYGTGWGTLRGLFDVAGLHGPPAAAAHLGAVWGGEQLVLPATGASPPAWKWAGKEVAIDLLHHGIYAAVTSTVYEILDPHRRKGHRHQ
jgi:hypothetical protein